MREVSIGAICGACGEQLPEGITSCPKCYHHYPYSFEASCKICYLPNYYFTIPDTGKSIIFCSNPDCAGYSIYHSGGLTYITHEKKAEFNIQQTKKAVWGYWNKTD